MMFHNLSTVCIYTNSVLNFNSMKALNLEVFKSHCSAKRTLVYVLLNLELQVTFCSF